MNILGLDLDLQVWFFFFHIFFLVKTVVSYCFFSFHFFTKVVQDNEIQQIHLGLC